MVSVDQINPYERNPRHGSNPEYDRIKASIRANGLDQPLVITQRPNTAGYIIHTGGNTRLSILKALYEETGEERFFEITCLFKPWHSESDVLLAHLRENDLRSGLTFIDRARAVLEAKALIKAESGLDDISQRRLEKELKDRGYTVAHGLISKMVYAVETLLPLIPEALGAGLGQLPVERIRRLERAAREIWKRRTLDGNAAYDQVFSTLCRRYDGADWDIELLRSAIETEIAEQAEISIHTIRVELEARMAGRTLMKPPLPEEPKSAGQSTDRETPHTSISMMGDPSTCSIDSLPQEPGLNLSAGEVIADVLKTGDAAMPDMALEGGRIISTDSEYLPHETAEPPDSPENVCQFGTSSGRGDLKSLRARSWTLAARLAQRNGIGRTCFT